MVLSAITGMFMSLLFYIFARTGLLNEEEAHEPPNEFDITDKLPE